MKKYGAIFPFFFAIIIFFGITAVINLAKGAEITEQEIQKLIIGKWTWQGKISERTMAISFEFFSNGSLDIRRQKDDDGSILFPPTALKKILKGTVGQNRLSYTIREQKIKVSFSSNEEVWGDILEATPTTLKINIRIGDSNFLFVLQKSR